MRLQVVLVQLDLCYDLLHPGSGVIAGGSTRTVLELAGVKNILSKQLGSNNLLNNARATIEGLSSLRSYINV